MIQKYWRLFRGENLLITALTLFLLQEFLIRQLLLSVGLDFSVSNLNRCLFIVSILFIIAAGNCINDCMDVITDAINRKNNRVIGVSISKQKGVRLYYSLSFIGIFLAIFPAYQLESVLFFLCFPIATFCLWKYSILWKRQPLKGNLVISVLTAMVIILSCWVTIGKTCIQNDIVSTIIKIYICFSLFAFLFTLIREMIKTIEDIRGDMRARYNTIAIKIGIKKTKRIILIFIGVAILFLILFEIYFLIVKWWLLLIYIFVLVLMPTMILFYKTTKIRNTKICHHLSLLSKFIMLTGSLASITLWYMLV